MYRAIAPLLILALPLAGCGKDQGFSESTIVATMGEAQLTAGQLEAFLLQAPEAPTILQGQSVLSLWLDHAGLVISVSRGDGLTDDGTLGQATEVETSVNRILRLAEQTRNQRPLPSDASIDSLGQTQDVRVYDRIAISIPRPADSAAILRAVGRLQAIRDQILLADAAEWSLARAPRGLLEGTSQMRTEAASRAELDGVLARAIWELEPGSPSDVVAGSDGVQIFVRAHAADAPEELRAWLRIRQQQRADSIFVDSLAMANGISIAPDALGRARLIAHEPLVATGTDPLVTFKDGVVSEAALRAWYGQLPPAARASAIIANDTSVSLLLTESAKRALMVRIAPPLSREDSARIVDEARAQITSLLESSIEIPGNEPSVKALNWMTELLAGTRALQKMPGTLGLVLRSRYGATVNFEALEWVVERAAGAWAVKAGQET